MHTRLFQYSVIKHPTKEQEKSGVTSEIIIAPAEFFLAASEAAVQMLAIKAIPEEHMSAVDRLEVAVRPF